MSVQRPAGGAAPRRTAGLGRGISALMNIPEESERHLEAVRPADVYFGGEPVADDLVPVPGLRLAFLDVEQIRPNPRQPRREFDEAALAELERSIAENGVLQPIVVRPAEPSGYELVMGERRLRASVNAGRRSIPAVIKETADEALLTEALIENLHRSELNALEEASAYQQLIDDFGITHEQLGAKLGLSRPSISNAVRLLNLPEPIQRKVAAGVISRGHAKAVLSVGKPELMAELTDKIIQEDLNVRQAEVAATRMAGTMKQRKPQGRRYERLDEIADRLGNRFDTRVRVDLNGRSGRIVIDFGSVVDLNRILADIGEEQWAEGEARERMLDERVAMLKR